MHKQCTYPIQKQQNVKTVNQINLLRCQTFTDLLLPVDKLHMIIHKALGKTQARLWRAASTVVACVLSRAKSFPADFAGLLGVHFVCGRWYQKREISVFEMDFIVHHVSFVNWWFFVWPKPRNDCRLQENKKSFIVATLVCQYKSVACSNLEDVEENFFCPLHGLASAIIRLKKLILLVDSAHVLVVGIWHVWSVPDSSLPSIWTCMLCVSVCCWQEINHFSTVVLWYHLLVTT